MDNSEWDDLPLLLNSWEVVIDEGVCKGCVNWQLYGSNKPTHVFEYDFMMKIAKYLHPNESNYIKARPNTYLFLYL